MGERKKALARGVFAAAAWGVALLAAGCGMGGNAVTARLHSAAAEARARSFAPALEDALPGAAFGASGAAALSAGARAALTVPASDLKDEPDLAEWVPLAFNARRDGIILLRDGLAGDAQAIGISEAGVWHPGVWHGGSFKFEERANGDRVLHFRDDAGLNALTLRADGGSELLSVLGTDDGTIHRGFSRYRDGAFVSMAVRVSPDGSGSREYMESGIRNGERALAIAFTQAFPPGLETPPAIYAFSSVGDDANMRTRMYRFARDSEWVDYSLVIDRMRLTMSKGRDREFAGIDTRAISVATLDIHPVTDDSGHAFAHRVIGATLDDGAEIGGDHLDLIFANRSRRIDPATWQTVEGEGFASHHAATRGGALSGTLGGNLGDFHPSLVLRPGFPDFDFDAHRPAMEEMLTAFDVGGHLGFSTLGDTRINASNVGEFEAAVLGYILSQMETEE